MRAGKHRLGLFMGLVFFGELSLHNSHGKIGVRVIIDSPGCRNLEMVYAQCLQLTSSSIQACPALVEKSGGQELLLVQTRVLQKTNIRGFLRGPSKHRRGLSGVTRYYEFTDEERLGQRGPGTS
jgi:hypothetical protein